MVPTSKLSRPPDKENFFELYACGFGRVQRLKQTRLVRTQAHVGMELPQLLLIEGEELARLASAGERIDQYQDLASAEVVDKVEHWHAEIEEFNLVAEFVLRAQWPTACGLRPSSCRRMLPMPATKMRGVILQSRLCEVLQGHRGHTCKALQEMWLMQVLISRREGIRLGALGEVTRVTHNICFCAQNKT